MRIALATFGLALYVARVASAQSLDDRIAAAHGTAGFLVATRANVCGDGHGIFVSDDSSPGWNTRHHSGTSIRHDSSNGDPCDIAPAHVVVEHDGARVTSLRTTVGGRSSSADVELGAMETAEAVRYLLASAPRLDGRSGDDAVAAVAIADAPKTWVGLLAIARDDGATESSRKSSLFWVSQQASAAAVAGLGSVASDDDASASVRSDALFYLAQRKDGSGIDALIRVARESKSPKLRKDAIWYLGRTRDPRALALFEQLLSGAP